MTMEKQGAKAVRLPDLEEVARRYIFCTKCSEISDTTILMCRKGHSVCKSCSINELTYCQFEESPLQICQSSYIKTPTKGILYQFIRQNSTFTCPNVENGCPMLMMGKYIKQHLDQCEYRDLSKCLYLNCSNLISNKLTDYHVHLSDFHYVYTIDNNNSQLELFFDSSVRQRYPKRLPCMFVCYRARFALVIHEYEERVAMWISLIYGPTTQKYKATFRMSYNKPQDDGDEHEEADRNATNDETVDDEDQNAPKDVSVASAGKKEDKIVSHEVHPLSIPMEDIVDMCECIDIPAWIVESSYLVKNESNRLIWPIEISIECEECIHDDEDVTIEFDGDDKDEEVDE